MDGNWGPWLTASVTLAGVFGTIITALIKAPSRKNGNGSDTSPNPRVCPAHSGLLSDIAGLHNILRRIEEAQSEAHKQSDKEQESLWVAVDDIRRDIKKLLERGPKAMAGGAT